jgi:hypothetical protein
MSPLLKRIYIAIAAMIFIGFPAAAAYKYQPPAQVVITNAEDKIGTITTREPFFSTPKIERVLIAHRPDGDAMLFCKQAGYPSVQYHCRSTYYTQAALFDRTAVGKTQLVQLAWDDTLATDRWD